MSGVTVCPVCNASSAIELEYRRDIPIAQNLVFKSQKAAQECAVGQLRMMRCRDCGFGWNTLFDLDLMRYDVTYDNDQNFSGIFRAHVDSVARRVVSLTTDTQLTVLEVGCGQGSFLSFLAEHLGGRLVTAVGFDPAWRGDGSRLPPSTRVVGDYFTAESASQVGCIPDVIISRHTIEHVPDPIPFLAAIRAAAKPGAVVIIETPSLDWILKNGMFFDFFYEHCSIFNPESMSYALRKVGLRVTSIDTVFDGQYLLATAVVPPVGEAQPQPTATGDFDDLGYLQYRDSYLNQLREIITDGQRGDGLLALWGGASKGVTVAVVLGRERKGIHCAIDINPRKQGGFMPGTGGPIVSPEEAYQQGVRTVIVMNPNYFTEISQYCAENDIKLRLVTI